MARAETRVGTSGWHYEHWVGPFYPEGTPADGLLPYYVDHFDIVEINNTFFQLREAATLAFWRDTAPAGFVFACKAGRFITHTKKLRDPARSIRRFFEAVETLHPKLGPILFQPAVARRVTADFTYIRLHGPGAAYQGSYDGRMLAGWARRLVNGMPRGSRPAAISTTTNEGTPRVMQADCSA